MKINLGSNQEKLSALGRVKMIVQDHCGEHSEKFVSFHHFQSSVRGKQFKEVQTTSMLRLMVCLQRTLRGEDLGNCWQGQLWDWRME